jgi:hypothetical protein
LENLKQKSHFLVLSVMELGERRRYSDWRQAGRPKVRSSSLSTPRRPDRFWVPHSLLAYRGWNCLGVKLITPRTSAEVKNTWIYTSATPYVFMA